MVDAREIYLARRDAGSQHDFIEIFQCVGFDTDAKALFDLMQFELTAKIAKCFVKLFLAGNFFRQIELTTDFRICVEQCYLMSALCRNAGQARPAGPAPTTAIRFGIVVLV